MNGLAILRVLGLEQHGGDSDGDGSRKGRREQELELFHMISGHENGFVHVVVDRLRDVLPDHLLAVAATRCLDGGNGDTNQRWQPTCQGCDLFGITVSRVYVSLCEQMGGIGSREQ